MDTDHAWTNAQMTDTSQVSTLSSSFAFQDERLDAAIYDEIPALCILLDSRLRIRKLNRFGCEQLGYQLDQLVGQPVHLLCSADERELYLEKLRSCLAENNGLKRLESRRLRKDGSRYWVRDTVRVISPATGELQILIVSEDITETRYLIIELERQGSIDALTGLYNRRRFDRHLEQAILSAKVEAEANAHVLCFIDLDQFKVVNDACGHLAGDELLRQIAHLLQQQIRGKDILARLGGDEFGLILDSCSVLEAESVCRKLLSSLARYRFTWADEVFTLGASIGLLRIDGASTNASDLLRYADTACYLAKDKGRNCIKVYDTQDAETQKRGTLMKWLSRLHAALDHDRFELYQQRIQPLRGEPESTTYDELLIRMRGENDELISPGAFIPAAEYYGLSGKIDRWVTREALRTLTARDTGDGTETVYFVNLSGLTLGDAEFIEQISTLLDGKPALRHKLCFEITETAAIQNLASAIQFIDHFRALGCMFALDDFGSGFSSFAYLKALPVDFIKIDGEFVRNIINEPMQLAIVQAIRLVADVSSTRTIAEHVEDAAVLNVLRGLSIDFGQGYYFDKPRPLATG
jgi:diguanylate cyclase (GGDEF)-like protein/PAS domain S-box-containing protein